MSEQVVKMAAKLYQCRDAAKGLYKGAEYIETLTPYMDLLRKVMKGKNIPALEAVIEISKTEIYQNSGMTQMLFMAAVVEITEPSENPKTPL